jgi:hypothetical protein
MDFELLNFWIARLNFDISHKNTSENPKLYVSLNAYSDDFTSSYSILLSENKNSILEFLGYDNTIKCDNLSEKNTFEYLCTSSFLNPMHIRFCGFKGPYAKNKQHQNFNEFLKKKQYYSLKGEEYYITQQEDKTSLLRRAISFFGKQEAFREYVEKKDTMDQVMLKYKYLKKSYSIEWSNFKNFLILYGMLNVINMDDDILLVNWNEFKKENWSGLSIF